LIKSGSYEGAWKIAIAKVGLGSFHSLLEYEEWKLKKFPRGELGMWEGE